MSSPGKLQHRLGYHFADEELLKQALTHRSFHAGNYERLEFLGDSILGFIIAEYLFQRFPAAKEGELSRLRSRIVKKTTLAQVAREFDLGDFLLMGGGELKSGGFERDSILSDVLEAIIASIYMDGGIDAARDRVLSWFSVRLEQLDLNMALKDPKSRLQEYLQARGCELPDYQIESVSGQSHEQEFTVACHIVLAQTPAIASGSSRKDAEQKAAAIQLARLEAGQERKT